MKARLAELIRQNESHPRIELEPIGQVMRRVRMCKSKLYKEIAGKRFPQPVKVGRGTAFVSIEVDAWIAAKIAERDELIGKAAALDCRRRGSAAQSSAIQLPAGVVPTTVV